MTFCELTDFKHFEGFRKSHDENQMSKITRRKNVFFLHNRGGGSDDYGKFHKKNVFLLKASLIFKIYNLVDHMGSEADDHTNRLIHTIIHATHLISQY